MDEKLLTWLSDYHKRAYEFQLERHEKLRDRISFIIGLLSALGGALIYVLSNYPHNIRSDGALFYLPIFFAVIVFFQSVALLIYCMGRGFDIAYMPPSTEIQRYAEEMTEYVANNPGSGIDVLLRVKTMVNKLYCKSATHNEPLNVRRSYWLLLSLRVGIISFTLLLLALPKFLYEKAYKEEEPTKVIFSESVKITK